MPAFSVADYLSIIQHEVPEELVSRQCLSSIRALAALLPGTLTRVFGFECRLGDESPRTDFLLGVKPTGGECEVLAGRASGPSFPPAFWRHPVWQRVRDFCLACMETGGALHDKLTDLWLEFDMEGPPPVVPIPSVFFGSECVRPDHQAGSHSLQWITREALPRVTGRRVPEPIARKLFDCVQRLPPAAMVFELAAMLGREPPFVRVCIHRLAPSQIIPYLIEIGWPGDADELGALIDKLGSLADQLCLDIDLSDRIGPKVGIECRCGPAPSARLHPGYPPLLDWLVRRGLCTPAKREALERYPGLTHERSSTHRWPEPILAMSDFIGAGHLSVMTRELCHIKVGYQQGHPLEAKAYPGAKHHWLPIERLRGAVDPC